MTLLQLHFFAASFLLGMFAVETILELCDRGAESRRTIARVHRWNDLLFEGPTAVLLLVTGGLLLARAWPPTPLLLVKAGLGLFVVLVNLVCMKWVLVRARADSDERVSELTRLVKLTGLAIPFAIAAFIIGLFYLPGQ